ncbi:MAG TPA: hypothetical protein PKD90_08895 [Phnomibacter sp.]|nr:hypothetical protein [Phnomibacter sp.]
MKKLVYAVVLLLLVASGIIWYVFTEKYDDTSTLKADYSLSAEALLTEFGQQTQAANRRYTEKILEVSGTVNQVEAVDTTVNVKFVDSTTGSYAIFSFQAQDAAKARNIKAGDAVTIRGSCSGGGYSQILETAYVNFKRCTLVKP